MQRTGVLGLAVIVAALLAASTARVDAPVAAPGQLCATPGREGASGVLGGIVNTYYPGTGSVVAGATSVPVGAPSGAAAAVAAGDLVLVLQVQGASLNDSDTDAYGDGVAGPPASGALSGTIVAGLYEFAVAAGPVAAGMLPVAGKGAGGGLLNAYVDAAATASDGVRRFQVVRVPQYATATAGGTLSAAAWNGSAGGVLALDVAGTLTLAGTVSVSGLGFRGGGDRQLTGAAGLPAGAYRTNATSNANGPKGEGSAGTPRWVQQAGAPVDTGVEGYPNGSQARGAPGNAGGGGTDGRQSANDQNTGGGGGGNGGAGGIGGNAWSSNLAHGGEGGAASPAGPASITLGGGGGAGTRNNTGPSGGASGGGLVLARAGAVDGSGTFAADGEDGASAANDGGGGGGAGGTVLVDVASGGLGGLAISANGGSGGSAWATEAPGSFPGNRHGPGGGGGGGLAYTTAAPGSLSLVGGVNGTTTTAADAYGATPGAGGAGATIVPSAVPGADAGARCASELTVTKSTATTTVVNRPGGTTAIYVLRVENEIARAAATGVSIADPLPSGLTYASTTSVALSGGATRGVTIDPAPGAPAPAWGTFVIPGGAAVEITFVAAVASSVPAGVLQNPAQATYDDPALPGGTLTRAYDPASDTADDVAVTASDLRIAKTHGAPFVRGSSGSYQLVVSNAGAAPTAGAVAVTDVLPPGLTPTAAAGAGWTCSRSGQSVACSRASVLPGGASFPSIVITVDVLASAPAEVTNTADVAGGGELDTSNNSASDLTPVSSAPPAPPAPPAPVPDPPPPTTASADLRVTVTGPGNARAGEAVTVRVDGANVGPDASPGSQLVITLPGGLTAVGGSVTLSGAPAGSSCISTGTPIRCSLGTIPAGASFTVGLRIRLGAPLDGRWVVQASLTGDLTDPVPANNAASHAIRARAMVAVPPRPDRGKPVLVLTKVAERRTVQPGARVTFRLTLRNTGDGAAVNILLCDQPSRRMTLVSAPGATLRQGRACWRIRTLPPRGRRTQVVVVRVDAAAPPGALRNAAILPERRTGVAASVTVLRGARPGRGGGVTG